MLYYLTTKLLGVVLELPDAIKHIEQDCPGSRLGLQDGLVTT